MDQDNRTWMILVGVILLAIGVVIFLRQRAQSEAMMSRALMEQQMAVEHQLHQALAENEVLRQQLEQARRR